MKKSHSSSKTIKTADQAVGFQHFTDGSGAFTMSTSPPVGGNTHLIVDRNRRKQTCPRPTVQLSLQLFAEAQRQLQLTATWMGLGWIREGCFTMLYWDSSLKMGCNGHKLKCWNAGPAPSRSSATILCSTLARSVDSGHKPCCCWRSCRDLPFNRCPDARAELGEGWILQKTWKILQDTWSTLNLSTASVRGFSQDSTTYASVIGSCERGQQIDKASVLLAELKRGKRSVLRIWMHLTMRFRSFHASSDAKSWPPWYRSRVVAGQLRLRQTRSGDPCDAIIMKLYV